jgi:DNA-binding GntR family transcriptional regulator
MPATARCSPRNLSGDVMDISSSDVRQIKPRLLYEAAAQEIRRAILGRVYEPGNRLNEVKLARDLNLSRGPVREALRQLEQEGLVSSEPQKGVRVRLLSALEARNALAIRQTLETLNLDEVVRAVSRDDLTDLEMLMSQMTEAERLQDIVEVVELDYLFHERFLEIVPSAVVGRTWRAIAGQIRMYLAIGDTTWAQSGSVAVSHEPIIDALKQRDAELLGAAIIGHIDENRSSIGMENGP